MGKARKEFKEKEPERDYFYYTGGEYQQFTSSRRHWKPERDSLKKKKAEWDRFKMKAEIIILDLPKGRKNEP